MNSLVKFSFLMHVFAYLFASSIAIAQPTQWPDPTNNEVLPYETTGLVSGPLLGRPQADSVRVWLQTTEPTPFEILVDTQLPLDDKSAVFSGETSAAKDMTGVVDITGLKSNQRYCYGVRINGELADLREAMNSPWPSFRTLPTSDDVIDPLHNPDGKFNVRFAVGHCASQAPIISGWSVCKHTSLRFDLAKPSAGDHVRYRQWRCHLRSRARWHD